MNVNIKKEKFINDINYQAMMAKIIKELTAIKDSSEITSEKVLSWVKRIAAQRSKKAMLDSPKDNKEFDIVGKIKHKVEPG